MKTNKATENIAVNSNVLTTIADTEATNEETSLTEKKGFSLFSIRPEDIKMSVRLSAIYLGLFLGALVCVLSVKYFKAKEKQDTQIIDVAGRQRMLSQQMAFLAEKAAKAKEQDKEELSKIINTYDKSLVALKEGGNAPGIDYVLPATTEHQLLSQLEEVQNKWLSYKTNLEIILNEPATIEQQETTTLTDTGGFATEEIKTKEIPNPKVIQAIEIIEDKANEILQANIVLVNEYVRFIQDKQKTLDYVLWIILLLAAVAVLVLIIQTRKYVTVPLLEIVKTAKTLARGDLDSKMKYVGEDELGTVSKQINSLVDNLKNVRDFAIDVGKGKFETDINVFNNDGELGTALGGMRDSLRRVAQEDIKRNWANEGLAKFGEILRMNNDNIEKLCHEILSNLIKYLKANQGGMFIVDDNSKADTFLELQACYAWGKKKYIQKEIRIGEGLIGQAWQENDIIYLTDVPDNYVNITSGLGEANPRSILIMPLKVNDNTYGVMEIASFNTYQKHEIDFVEKLSENIASTISGVKVNAKTKALLEETQQQAEELQAQEEEVRQNMEEMQATQEEMKRLQEEMETQLNIINKTAIVSKTNLKGDITYVNDEFVKWSKYRKDELMGQNHRILKSGHQSDEIFVEMWKTISSGKIWRGEVKNKDKDGSYYWVDAVIAPVMDENNKPKEYMAVRFVVNEQKEREEEMKQLLEETRAQEEELRQSMEDMQATQEEISRVNQEIQAQMSIVNKAAIVSKTDLRGYITYVNDEFCRVAKYKREELIGQNHNIIRHPDMPKEAFEDMWKTISSGKVWRGQVKNRCKDGEYYWVDATIAPIIGENGKPREYMAVRYIITDYKQQEEELKKCKAELAKLKK